MERIVKKWVRGLSDKGQSFFADFLKSRRYQDGAGNQSLFHLDLDAKIKHLITKSWGPQQKDQHKNFLFAANLAANVNGLEQFTTGLLHHVRRVAPTLNVPWLTPRVTVSSLTSAAGRFIEDDGWVRIEVDNNFLLQSAAAKAILCHEVCHYVLEASGIREAQTADNERLTDVAIFVFGLGEVFLSGYRRNPGKNYRQGHRLGYLTDDEYQYVRRAVTKLRASGQFQKDEASELRQRLKAKLLGDDRKLARYMEAARRKFPFYNEAELLKSIIDDFNSGR